MREENRIQFSPVLFGAGSMAVEYAKVLRALGHVPEVVGRGAETAGAFKQATGLEPVLGGCAQWLGRRPQPPDAAIVAVSVESLADVASALIEAGCPRVLLEKPGGANAADIRRVNEVARANGAAVFVAYNRRFYASVARARDLIEVDGGALSVSFEFTEKSSHIAAANLPGPFKAGTFLYNSSHVVDLAFFLSGWPLSIYSLVDGTLDWHPAGCVFAGSGRTNRGALFSYHANWASGGRWGVEVMTARRRLILRPLERLFVQLRGSFDIAEEPLDDSLDLAFKPGLMRGVSAFLSGDVGLFPNIEEQCGNLEVYRTMNPHWTGWSAP